jgi:hypothetical protein
VTANRGLGVLDKLPSGELTVLAMGPLLKLD